MNNDPHHPESSPENGRYGREAQTSAAPTVVPTTPAPARPVRRRPNVALGVGLGALGLAALVTGGMALTASRTQDTTEKFVHTLTNTLNSSGVVRVENSTYTRGLASSTQVMKVALDDPDTGKPVRLTITNRIQHGPLPGFQAVGQALVDTEIRFDDPKLQAKVDQAFAQRKPQIRTLVGLDGGTHTTVDVPQGQITEEGDVLSWQPLKGSVDVRGLTTHADMTWPGLKLAGDDVNGLVGPFTLKTDMQRLNAQDQLGVGQARFNLGNMTVTSAGETVSFKNFTVETVSKQNGKDHYDAQARYAIGEVVGAGQNFRNLQLQIGLRHLARDPLNRIIKVIGDVQATARPTGAAAQDPLPDLTAAQEKQLENDVVALIKGKPEFSVDRLSLTQPGGDVVLKARVAMPGAAALSGEQLNTLMGAPAALMGVVELDASLNAPRRALEDLLGTFGGTPMGGLDELIGGGMLKEQGGQISSELRFANGKMLLNGQDLGAF